MLQKYDPRNKNIKVWIDGTLYKREDAKISVFDSLSQGGDAVWEGLRVYDGRIFCLDEHLNRLMESAKSLAFEKTPSIAFIKDAIFTTLKANKMYDETHIRLTLTRGKKITSGMNPQLNQFGCTLIILAEWKPAIYSGKKLKLVTSNIRRNSPLCLDSKIHHNNLLNNILAKIEANHAKADDALMLDLNGIVAETNATNIFMIKNGTVFAYGLDVYNGEPKIHPEYLKLKNIFLLPHLGSATKRTRWDMAYRATKNLEDFFSGKKPQDQVN